MLQADNEFMNDVVTAFNQARIQVADDFDEIRRGNDKFIDSVVQDFANSVVKNYGKSQLEDFFATTILYQTTVVAEAVKLAESVASSTFFDVLRLGEGVKKGTAGGYFEDGLRVLAFVGPAVKALRYGNFLLRAGGVGGGTMSCMATSTGKALLYSRLARVATVEEIANGMKGEMYGPVKLPWFPGGWPQDFKIVMNNAAKFGAKIEQVNVQSIEEVFRLAEQGNGPVVFGVEWLGHAGAPGGAHILTAYKPLFGSGLRFADQFGNVHKFVKQGSAWTLIAGEGTSTAHLLGAARLSAGDTIGSVKGLWVNSTYVMHDAMIMDVAASAPLAQRMGMPLFEMIDSEFLGKVAIKYSLSRSPPTKLKAVGADVRLSIGRNKRRFATQYANTVNRGIPLSSHAERILRLLPLGAELSHKEAISLINSSGVPAVLQYKALGELEGWGAIEVVRVFGGDPLYFVSITRRR